MREGSEVVLSLFGSSIAFIPIFIYSFTHSFTLAVTLAVTLPSYTDISPHSLHLHSLTYFLTGLMLHNHSLTHSPVCLSLASADHQ